MTEKKEEYEFELDPGAKRGTLRLHPGNPSGVAAEFLAEWMGERLVWRGDFYRWAGSHWTIEDESDVMGEVNRSLMDSYYEKWVPRLEKNVDMEWNPNNTSLSNLKTQLMLQAALPTGQEPERGGEFVFCRNGRVHTSTRLRVPHDPSVFNLSCSPFDYDENAKCPEFDRLLKETFGGDDVAIQRHLLWMAAELIGAISLQKAYVLVGQPGSGKGTLMKIGNALVGHGQVTGMALDQFMGTFSLAHTVGKSVCRISDVREVGKATSTAVQRLLSIVGGDIINIDRKGKEDWVGALPVLFTMESNEVIRLPDASGAIIRRLVTNRTVGSRQESMDPGLADRIIRGEMSGVLNRVLDHVEGVYGEWPETEASLEAREELRMAAQPLRSWMEDREWVEGFQYAVPRDEAYQDYVDWAHENGVRMPMDKSWFVRNMRALLPGVGKPVRRGPKNSQEWYLVGFGRPDSGARSGS